METLISLISPMSITEIVTVEYTVCPKKVFNKHLDKFVVLHYNQKG